MYVFLCMLFSVFCFNRMQCTFMHSAYFQKVDVYLRIKLHIFVQFQVKRSSLLKVTYLSAVLKCSVLTPSLNWA